MNNIFLIIGLVYLSAFFLTLLTIPLEKKYKKKLNKSPKCYKDLYVLLPALKEQKIVKTTIDWFSNIKYNGNIKFVIITTQKEEYEYKKNNIKELNDDRFIHYHYNRTDGNKSSQMNFAIELIRKNYNPDLENTYISVFDFDSKPELNTFEMLNRVAELRNNPDAINQVPLTIKNYEEHSKNKIIMLLYSMHQLIRSCAIEKIRLLISSFTNFKVTQYCMGACMHLKMSTLIKNDCFPIFVDDLTLGYRMSIRGNTFAYLPSYNYVLIPNDLKNYINSYTLIFKGICTYLREIRINKNHIWGKFKMFLVGTANVLTFAVIPWLLVIYYIYSLLSFNITFTFILCFLVPYLWCIASYIVIKNNNIKDNKVNSYLAILISPIWFIFKPLGFIVHLKRLIISKFLKKEIVYKKTER